MSMVRAASLEAGCATLKLIAKTDLTKSTVEVQDNKFYESLKTSIHLVKTVHAKYIVRRTNAVYMCTCTHTHEHIMLHVCTCTSILQKYGHVSTAKVQKTTGTSIARFVNIHACKNIHDLINKFNIYREESFQMTMRNSPVLGCVLQHDYLDVS